MATRLIVTSHPDVACDVCGRRLLRGEQSDVFLGGGQRRTVCELCAPRAAHEGWRRETDHGLQTARPARSRRTRSLLGRLRQLREPGDDTALPAAEGSPLAAQAEGDGLYDFLDSPLSAPRAGEGGDLFDTEPERFGSGSERGSGSQPEIERAGTVELEPVAAAQRSTAGSASVPGGVSQAKLDRRVRRAVELFNAGEQPRRLAGIARSLGAPAIRVAVRADSDDVVALLLAWELCWYRYEVDLADEGAGVRLAGEGMELGELMPAERVANAVADERGKLSLLD